METHTRLQKKEQKKTSILNSAYTLFLKNGIAKTSIDDIVQDAKIAKGTFYLYFKDKEDVLDKLVTGSCLLYMQQACNTVSRLSTESFQTKVHAFINTLIDIFKKNKPVLRLIKKDFSWPIAKKGFEAEENDDMQKVLFYFIENCPYAKNHTRDESMRLLYMTVEMVGSICYESIIKNEPAPIEELRPEILNIVDRILC